MILYRKEPYPLQMKNIMLLDDNKSGGVVYVNKATYDQALMLSSRFDGDIARIIASLKNKKNEAYIATPGLPKLIDEMGKTMPEPINVLAPFLMFCVANQGIEWSTDKRIMAYGILHQYSQLIDFNAVFLVPPEIRSNISFPTALLMQYETSWDDLCSTLRDKVVPLAGTSTVIPMVTATTPVTQAVPASVQPSPQSQPVSAPQFTATTQQPAPAVSESEEDGLSPMEKRILEMKKRREAEHQEMLKKEAEKKKEKSKPKPAPASTLSNMSEEENKRASNAILDSYDV